MKKYILISATTVKELETKMDETIKSGGIPTGGIFITTNLFYQAVWLPPSALQTMFEWQTRK